LQGSPQTLTAITNHWIRGATENALDTHPFRNPFFEGQVAHGYFIASAAAGLFVDPPM
jgi:hypothetical protein